MHHLLELCFRPSKSQQETGFTIVGLKEENRVGVEGTLLRDKLSSEDKSGMSSQSPGAQHHRSSYLLYHLSHRGGRSVHGDPGELEQWSGGHPM